jgi:hypothetical protein
MKFNIIIFASCAYATIFTYWDTYDCSGDPVKASDLPTESCQIFDFTHKGFQLREVDNSFAYVAGVDETCFDNMNYITIDPSTDASPCINYTDSGYISFEAIKP